MSEIWVRSDNRTNQVYFYFKKINPTIDGTYKFNGPIIGESINYSVKDIYDSPQFCNDRKLEPHEVVTLKIKGII